MTAQEFLIKIKKKYSVVPEKDFYLVYVGEKVYAFSVEKNSVKYILVAPLLSHASVRVETFESFLNLLRADKKFFEEMEKRK